MTEIAEAKQGSLLGESSPMVGVVFQAENSTYITLIVNHGTNLSHGAVLGLDAGGGRVVLCIVEDIAFLYHLNDTKRFFSGFSAEDKLHQIARGSFESPLYTQEVKARVLGIYLYDDQRGLRPAPDSVDRYTPMALQKVYKLNESQAKIVLGLDPLGVKIGSMQYPYSGDIEVPMDSLGRHTLVSGVTGSGKSRMVGIICKKFVMSGGCITIIDPHDEYTNLLAADETMQNIYRYEMATCEWSIKKWRTLPDKDKRVYELPLILSEKQLTPSSLSRLLPFISEQQEQEIHNYFQKARGLDGSLIDNMKKFMEEALSNLPAKAVDKVEKADRSDVLKALIRKISLELDTEKKARKITDKIYINNNVQKWQEPASGEISILCGDYNRSGTGKRFLAALLEQFLRTVLSSNKIKQMIVIEEAHQIFRLQDVNVQMALEQLLREARKFGITILLVTQNIFDIPENMRTQIQNVFSFRDPSIDEIKYLEERCCRVKLYGGKAEFIMKAVDCPSLIDAPEKAKSINRGRVFI